MDQTYPIYDTTDRTFYDRATRSYYVKVIYEKGHSRAHFYMTPNQYKKEMEKKAEWDRYLERRSNRNGSNPLPSATPHLVDLPQAPNPAENPPHFQHHSSSTAGHQQPPSHSYQNANNPRIQAPPVTKIFECCTLL